MATVKLIVTEIVGSQICVASADGHKVHERVFDTLSAGDSVVLSFENVRRMTTAFLNSAIGQLFNEFDESEISAKVHFEDTDKPIEDLLKRVIERAKTYFSNTDRVARAVNGAIEE